MAIQHGKMPPVGIRTKILECLYSLKVRWQRLLSVPCQDKHCKQVKCVNQWNYIVVFLPVNWPRQNLQSFHGVVKCIVLLQNKVWKRLCAVSSSTCFDGTNTYFCRETGYVANTRFFFVLFGLQFDSDISDLTSRMPALPALWQHRLPCGRVVVEHEMCGYCGPISLKILWSPPPETEEAIRK